ncbi:hypothetical protein PQR34_42160 [Paraburkholderia sediminicola]|uniref:hypothetical protein n=1 Tax=Paraburkholderia sediminicola TaxID=458836 RepID=UPI0038BDCC52
MSLLTTLMPSSRSGSAVLMSALFGMLAAGAAVSATAQQVTNPGDLIIERQITPRDAFVPVPKSQDPVAVKATTFPAVTFDAAIGSMASDLDLNGAHGSSGVNGGGFMPTLVGANGVGGIEHLLAGNSGSNVPVGSGASLGGLGGSIAQSITGALAPLGAVLGAMK